MDKKGELIYQKGIKYLPARKYIKKHIIKKQKIIYICIKIDNKYKKSQL